ncbi:MAG: hypothetical protein GY696_23460 [Gammaproteobacteria bacterium]|nr:hypothetical protein [Gammaproteobacteria bacterium]
MSEGESERTTPKSIKPPKNPIAKPRDYPGPTPKQKENPRGAAKRKRGQSQHNTPVPGTSAEPEARKMTRDYSKKSQNLWMLNVFRKVKVQKTVTTIKMALAECDELRNYHDTMIEEIDLTKLHAALSSSTQPGFCPICESQGTTNLTKPPLMKKPGNHYYTGQICSNTKGIK